MILGLDFNTCTLEDEAQVKRKWHKYVMKCKGAAWKRFYHEYLVALEKDITCIIRKQNQEFMLVM